MSKILKAGLLVVLTVIVLPIAFVVGTSKEHTILEGEAFGFAIGDSHEKALVNAKLLKTDREIEEMKWFPDGAAPRHFNEAEIDEAMASEQWLLVVDSKWWNNSITLFFEFGKLAKIYRYRFCCEMP
jgi:hypothetical protein